MNCIVVTNASYELCGRKNNNGFSIVMKEFQYIAEPSPRKSISACLGINSNMRIMKQNNRNPIWVNCWKILFEPGFRFQGKLTAIWPQFDRNLTAIWPHIAAVMIKQYLTSDAINDRDYRIRTYDLALLKHPQDLSYN